MVGTGRSVADGSSLYLIKGAEHSRKAKRSAPCNLKLNAALNYFLVLPLGQYVRGN